MTKQEAAAHYAAFAGLEAAAEAFYTAADRMAKLLPSEANALYALSEHINMHMASIDAELDEVL